jgi:His-Xaa-Ser system radical SAM maturase HxsC
MRLTTAGIAGTLPTRIVGRVTMSHCQEGSRTDMIRLVIPGESPTLESVYGFKAVLSTEALSEDLQGVPRVEKLRDWDHLREGDIVSIDPTGFVRSLYRPADHHHSLFATERCNSNCLMCSQPPKDKDDTTELIRQNVELLDLISPGPPYMTITGGEPTLLGRGLFTLIDVLKKKLPTTEVHMLTNGRTFAWSAYTRELAAVKHPNFSVGVPLYSDFAEDHDYIVQAKGAFDQTISGLQQLGRYGIRCEIRVVLHKLTIPRLTRLAEYIYRNLTFVEHIALMGLEHVGYAPRNMAELWIDPYDYQNELEEAVKLLRVRGMQVSIYNQQLCVLRPSLWNYSRKAISDWKNEYLEPCGQCVVFNDCGGLFKWNLKKHSDHIKPFSENPLAVYQTVEP